MPGKALCSKDAAAQLLMDEEMQTSGNSSWSAAGGLEQVSKKGLPTLPLSSKVGERNGARDKQAVYSTEDGLGADSVLWGWGSFRQNCGLSLAGTGTTHG